MRADNLSRLNDEGRAALLDHGVRTVIDLRDPREIARDPHPLRDDPAVAYRNVPLISDAEWEAIRDPEVLRRGYLVTLQLSRSNLAAVVEAIAAAPEGATVVHCHAGKERTGLVTAVLLALVDATDETIADDYVVSDINLTSLYEEWAARETDPEARSRRLASFASRPEHIIPTLEEIRRLGGAARYLEGAGADKSALRRLVRRLRDEPGSSTSGRN